MFKMACITNIRLVRRESNGIMTAYPDTEVLGAQRRLLVIGLNLESAEREDPNEFIDCPNVEVTVKYVTEGGMLKVMVPESATMQELKDAVLSTLGLQFDDDS